MIHIEIAAETKKHILLNLMQLYQHDLSEHDGTLPDSEGRYSKGQYFELYWIEAERYPYIIYEDKTPIGFALVRDLLNNNYSMAEFFIIRPARGAGRGTTAAHLLFNMHPGLWHVAQQQENFSAQAFWKVAIDSYTRGNFQESWSSSSPVGPKQTFIAPNYT